MTKAIEPVRLNTAQLMERLQRHYMKPGENLPGGVFLPEVSWNGRHGTRRCDALHVGFTSTSGQVLTGHELKVSRADLLHELDDHHKADEWASQCHKWYLVVNDVAITTGVDLPHGWGLMVPGRSKTRMDVVVRAIAKPAGHAPSWDAVRSIIARQDTLRAQAITNARTKAHQDASAEVAERVSLNVAAEIAKAEHAGVLTQRATERLRELCKALGVEIDWHGNGGWANSATLDQVREVGEVLAATRSVDVAVKQLTGSARMQLRGLDQLVQRATLLRDMLDGVVQHAR